MALRKTITRGFKFRGLSTRLDAVKDLESVLSREPDVQEALDKILDTIKANIDKGEIAAGVIDREVVARVIAELSRDERDLAQDAITVIDAYSIPRFKYNFTRKQFFKVGNDLQRNHAEAQTKIEAFRERYLMIQQRLLRHEMFAAPVVGTGSGPGGINTNRVQLTQVESLVGTREQACIFGMLVEGEAGEAYLEDLNGKVKLDLSCANSSVGLFTHGCFVLAEGRMVEDVFAVEVLSFPPSETREDSVTASGGVDFLGQPPLTEQDIVQMHAMEEASTDAMFVVLSDVHLDNPQVLRKLRVLFSGFNSIKPPLFVLQGNFSSRPFGIGDEQVGAQEFSDGFNALGDLMLEFPDLLESSHFVFVPGPDDLGAPNLLPRARIPKLFTREMEAKILSKYPDANITFTTNPCRIKFYTQEIVVFRDNLVKKMRKHCVIPPRSTVSVESAIEQPVDEEDDDSQGEFSDSEAKLQTREVPVQLTEHLVKTLLDQAHLCPLPLEVQPVHWAREPALRLYPLPDLLILADNYDQYQWNVDCSVFNPGPFYSDYSFVVYWPASWKTEFSRVPE